MRQSLTKSWWQLWHMHFPLDIDSHCTDLHCAQLTSPIWYWDQALFQADLTPCALLHIETMQFPGDERYAHSNVIHLLSPHTCPADFSLHLHELFKQTWWTEPFHHPIDSLLFLTHICWTFNFLTLLIQFVPSPPFLPHLLLTFSHILPLVLVHFLHPITPSSSYLVIWLSPR